MPKKPIEVFTSIDLEMNQPSGKIIQIGAVTGNIVSGQILEKLSLFVQIDEEVTPYITHLTGITQNEVNNGMSLFDAYLTLKNMHKKYDSFVNPVVWGGSDMETLYNQLFEINPEFDGWCFGRRWIDVKTLYISWRIANGQTVQGGLSSSLHKVGINFKGKTHNGADDAENTFYMYRKLLSFLKNS